LGIRGCKDVRHLDWSLLQRFARVARAGSLSAAARAHAIGQPKLGRHRRAREAAVGQSLMARTAAGQAPRPAGAAIREQVRQMEEAAARAALAAAGASARLEGWCE
jgi:DNA-binding transcriptional LysR family regulator